MCSEQAMARVLIIDDDNQVRSALRRWLERAGHDAFEAENGNEGLRLLGRERVDLVITDILMPEKEGLETIIELKRDYPGTKVIAISGSGQYASLEYLKAAERLGADRSFSKPIDRDRLLAAIERLLAEDEDEAQG